MGFNEKNVNRDTAGRFDEKPQSEAEAHLPEVRRSETAAAPGSEATSQAGTATSEVGLEAGEVGAIEVPFAARWCELNVLLTPRHRKPQDVMRDLEVRPFIDSVSSDQAPVGFTVYEDKLVCRTDEDGVTHTDFEPTVRELRVFEGRLYHALDENVDGEVRQMDATRENILGRALYGGPDRKVDLDAFSEVEAHVKAQQEVDAFLAVDGKLWQVCGEPVYYVQTYGLGSNHGGTSLYIGDSTVEANERHHAASESVFPADQREAAIAYAQKVAVDRGDTDSLAGIAKVGTVDISGCFTPGTAWTPAPRLSYTDAYDAQYNGEVAQGERRAHIAREFDRFKAELLTVPGAVVDVPDGWGGMTKRVDTSKLTVRQAQDFDTYTKLTSRL